MIACIIIVGLGLAWLMRESDWLRVNLMGTHNPLPVFPTLMLPVGVTRPVTTLPEVIELPGDGRTYAWYGTVAELRAQIEELSKVELEIAE